MQQAFKAMVEAFADITASMPNADRDQARTAENGYPVRIRNYDGEGKLRTNETVVT